MKLHRYRLNFSLESRGLRQRVVLDLRDWHFDPEKQSPLDALGISPWKPLFPATIGQLVQGGAAVAAGLMVGDTVVVAGDREIAEWSEFVDVVQSHPGTALPLQLQRDGQSLTVTVIPEIKAP